MYEINGRVNGEEEGARNGEKGEREGEGGDSEERDAIGVLNHVFTVGRGPE